MRSTRTKSASLALRRWRNRRYFDRLVQRYVCGRSIPSWGLCRPHLICAQTPRVVGQGWSTTQQRYSSRLRAGATYLPVRMTMTAIIPSLGRRFCRRTEVWVAHFAGARRDRDVKSLAPRPPSKSRVLTYHSQYHS